MLTGNELFFLGILSIFFRMKIDKSLQKDHNSLERYGKVLIVLYILMLVFNAGIALAAVLRSLKELCKKDKKEEMKESGLTNVIVKRYNRKRNMSRFEKKFR